MQIMHLMLHLLYSLILWIWACFWYVLLAMLALTIKLPVTFSDIPCTGFRNVFFVFFEVRQFTFVIILYQFISS